ncbi:MAG TPA: tetratricopeptide repeat protein, partial [Polyangiaceae bacterium]|nr:tetratricopeptide repeat protein [Polyangiaceae bacterium]
PDSGSYEPADEYVSEEAEPEPEPEPEPAQAESEPAPPADVPQLLASAAAFRRVRLYAKALDALVAALELEPRSVEVYEAMRDIYLEDNRVDEAVQAMLFVASLNVDALDGDAAARTLQDVLAYDPNNARAIEMLRELGYEVVDEYGESSQAGEITEQGYTDEASQQLPSYDLEEMGPQDVSPQYASPNVVARGGEPDPLPRFAMEAQEPDASSVPPRPGGSAAPTGLSLEEALEESEFFASRGLLDDAYNILVAQLERYPNHPLLRERLAELEYPTEASGAHERPVSGETDRSFAIAESLDVYPEAPVTAAGGFSSADQQVDIEEVFAKFKQGVETQVAEDDSQTHYDLAVAYKEMGLIDDAIREFDTASRDQEMECVCQSMIGSLELARGNMTEAVEAFLRGLNAPVKEPQQETLLLYELGNAYEAKKMPREALAYFQKVVRKDPRYRDVAERITHLGHKVPGRAS